MGLALHLASGAPASRAQEGPAPEGLVEAGRRIYREGRLPSGAPVSAVVQGDVPVDGTQFSCQSCHGRSGLGAGEGSIVVPPVSGPLLFQPAAQLKRPAYDERTLARALRDGIDAAGRPLDPLMPRYRLADRDTAALAAYLGSLSAAVSPGVDAAEIRFATVVTSDVSMSSRGAMLDVLRAYFEEKARETRVESRRLGHDPPMLGGRRPSSYRRWSLDVWELEGEAAGWSAQLEARYRARPVFALLAGLSGRPWAPIHDFCERHELPCLLPSTNLPAAGAGGFYTLYFSRGLYLEADLLTHHLGERAVSRVLQVFRKGGPGAAAAAALGARLGAGTGIVEDWALGPGEGLRREDLMARLARAPNTAGVLWLDRRDIAGLGGLPATGSGRLLLSSTLLERRFEDLGSLSPGSAIVAHPFALPGEPDPALRRFRIWLRSRGIEPRDEQVQAQAYFACLAATEGIMHVRRHYYRDYFLDVLDHAQGLSAYLPLYPNPSLGPGQRYLSKGGYLIALPAAGPAPPRWIVP